MNFNLICCKKIAILFACLLLSLFVCAQQNIKISLKGNQITYKEAFESIEEQTKLVVAYNETKFDANKKLNANFVNQPLEKVLKDILSKTDFTYKINAGNIVLQSKQSQSTVSNTKKISGTILDDSQLPLIGVSVLATKSNNTVISDIDGNFTIEVADNDVLQVSYIGFQNQEMKISSKTTNYNITLLENSKMLDEVVVVGYGTVKKGNLTTSVTSVKGETLQNRPSQTVTDVLQGEVAGLNIVSSGKPGQAASIQLRGATSLNSSGSPLVLIDGIPGEFNYLNVDDIESLTVLKDAASAAIYGSRAAHGVILVTTKRGKSGKPLLRYNGFVGINTPTDMPEMVSSADYARMRNESLANIGRAPIYTDEDIARYADGSDLNRYPNTMWIDLLFKNSVSTRHSMSVAGGTDAVKYHTSAGFDHQTGVVPQVQQNVFNVRSNVDVKINSKFNLSFDMRYIQRKKDEVAGWDMLMQDIYKMNPTQVAYYTNGDFGYNPSAIINPIGYFYKNGHEKYDRHDANGILKLDYQIFKDLKFTGLANANYVFANTTTPGRIISFTDYFSKEEVELGQNTLVERRAHKYYYNLQALLNYNKKVKEHSFDVLLGYQQENQKDTWISASRDGFPTDLVHQLTGGSKERWTNDGNGEHWAIASFIGRLNYDYAGKYMLTANFRSDGSSRFASGHRWSTFPSVSAAWRITGESFMDGFSNYLSDMKLRASWGRTGASSGLGLYPSYTTIGIGSTILGNSYQQTAYLKSIGNTELGWEVTKMLDFGTDISMLNSRLNVVFDYYIKKSDDILIGLPVPLEYGFGKPKVNIGSVENKGWELEVGWNDRIGAVSYSVKGNISNNTNKVKDLGGTGPWKDGYTDVGLPMNSLYGYEAIGIFQTEEEIKNAPFQDVRNRPGDIRYVDQNNDGKINGDDRVVIGDRHPHYLYGLRLAGEYKGFDVSMFFQGVGKKDYIMNGPGIQPLTNIGMGPIFKHQTDYWSEDNRDAKYPRILDNSNGSFNYATSDFWKINGRYFRMKNLQIGYKLPASVLKPAGIGSLRVFFSATNLFTIDNFIPGYDPETTNAYSYPLAKTYSFGLNLEF